MRNGLKFDCVYGRGAVSALMFVVSMSQPTGTVVTFAGSLAGTSDGVGTSALFIAPKAISIIPDATFALLVRCACDISRI